MFGWVLELILGNLPSWLWPAVAGGGAAVFFFASIISNFPTFRPYTLFIKPVGFAAVIFGTFMYGGAGITEILQKQIEEQKAKVAVAEQAAKDANENIKTKIITNTKIIHDKQIVVQEKLVQDSSKIDAECKLDPLAVKDINEAAKNPLGGAK